MSQRIVYFENPNSAIGNSVVSLSPRYTGTTEDAAKQAIKKQGLPDITPWQEVEDSLEPVFKNARRVADGKLIADLTKSKLIAHGIRRIKRSEEFMPLDNDNPNIVVTAETETQRVIIRDKYAGIQTSFDNVNSVNALKGLMIAQGWIN